MFNNSVIPNEADEGGAMRNLLLINIIVPKMCIKDSAQAGRACSERSLGGD